MTVKLLLIIYGRLDRQALKVGNPISFSAHCHAFFSSLHKFHEHSIANCLSNISSALVVQVVQIATFPTIKFNPRSCFSDATIIFEPFLYDDNFDHSCGDVASLLFPES